MYSTIAEWVFLCLLLIAIAALFHRRLSPTAATKAEPQDVRAQLADSFLILPYLQQGNSPALSATETVEIWWHVREGQRQWQVQVQAQGEADWRTPVSPQRTVVDIATFGTHLRFLAVIDDLPPGAQFEYRILVDGGLAFFATGKARSSFAQPYSFVVAGDIGEPERKHEQAVAQQIYLTKPDFIAMPGDLAYTHGLVSQYRKNVFPVYNAEQATKKSGAPIMRSRIILPAVGNHDVALASVTSSIDFTKHPDLLGYFQFWSLPLNGPCLKPGDANTAPLVGDEKAHDRFAAVAGERFPRMAMYSIDWGNSHWTVLDTNAYVDWTDVELRAWVEADLAKNQHATWRFVMLHHPAFTSDLNHQNEQRSRLLCSLFEKYNVDVVFAGHNHCFEITHALRFKETEQVTRLFSEECPVPGELKIDPAFDGNKITKPDGIVYVVAGAAGAKFDPKNIPTREQWKPFTRYYDQEVYSFLHVEVNGKRLVMRQITEHGSKREPVVIEK